MNAFIDLGLQRLLTSVMDKKRRLILSGIDHNGKAGMVFPDTEKNCPVKGSLYFVLEKGDSLFSVHLLNTV